MLLEVKKLKKKFQNKEVLKEVSFEVNEGDVIGIIGPSGCGKSTLLKCINYLLEPSSGEIIFEGKKINKNYNLNEYRCKIGMVFQQYNLFENLTVLDNIILAPVKHKIMSKEEAKKEAYRLLKKIGLYEKRNSYPRELSGGQKQRTSIVRALIMKPKLMLYDEPTTALDPEVKGDVTSLMREIAGEGMSMIIVSHEIEFIKDFASKVIFMDDGKIVEYGECKKVLNNPKDDRIKEFLSKVKDV